ncbi:helix-turn-helix transcriptional regulator [Jeongeupia chitinilytica]|uniref:helix-turn-helix transcriptional regulator n=1 Tax=Jeongeupia chitinilytica TaxID=1041641 RepID=UPI0016754CE9|nr:AlpA family transcriptional regulator [Jeongeupia chitinilytica]
MKALVQVSASSIAAVAPAVDHLLRLQAVCRQVALSRSSIYAAIAAGTFPKPIRLGGNSVAWLQSEVSAWVAERIAERDQEVARERA